MSHLPGAVRFRTFRQRKNNYFPCRYESSMLWRASPHCYRSIIHVSGKFPHSLRDGSIKLISRLSTVNVNNREEWLAVKDVNYTCPRWAPSCECTKPACGAVQNKIPPVQRLPAMVEGKREKSSTCGQCSAVRPKKCKTKAHSAICAVYQIHKYLSPV